MESSSFASEDAALRFLDTDELGTNIGCEDGAMGSTAGDNVDVVGRITFLVIGAFAFETAAIESGLEASHKKESMSVRE